MKRDSDRYELVIVIIAFIQMQYVVTAVIFISQRVEPVSLSFGLLYLVLVNLSIVE